MLASLPDSRWSSSPCPRLKTAIPTTGWRCAEWPWRTAFEHLADPLPPGMMASEGTTGLWEEIRCCRLAPAVSRPLAMRQLPLVLLLAILPGTARSQTAADRETFFEVKVRPILAGRCFK